MTGSVLGEPDERLPCLCGRTVRVWWQDRIIVLGHAHTACGVFLGVDDPERFVTMLRARPKGSPSWRPVGLVLPVAEAERLAREGKRVVAVGEDWVEYGSAIEKEDGDGDRG